MADESPEIKPEPLEGEIISTRIEEEQDEYALPLSKRGRKAMDYLIARLQPFGFQGDDGRAYLEYTLTPLLKATHVKKISWHDRIAASKILAEMVGLYMAGERSQQIRSYQALPRRARIA